MSESKGPQKTRGLRRLVPTRKARGVRRLLAALLLVALAPDLTGQLVPSTNATPDVGFAAAVEAFRVEHGFPAVAGSIFTSTAILELTTTGVRSAGKPDRVTDQDLWHIGSITKSFTSALTARFVEQGRLDWDDTLSKLLPEIVSVDSPHAAVTLRQLLSHRGGIAANPSIQVTARVRSSAKPMQQQRLDAVAAVLAEPPTTEREASFLYSNVGYMAVGAVLEKISQQPWEDLLQGEILEPLQLRSSGFGAPGSPGNNDQPRGHSYGEATGRRFPAEPPLADNPAFFGPAGTLHMSLGDLTRWGRWHLAGHLGKIEPNSPLSDRATFEILHDPKEGQDYALGWVQQPAPEGTPKTIWHNGSNTYWYALVMFQPEFDLGVVLITNAGIDAASEIDREAQTLLQEYRAVRRQ